MHIVRNVSRVLVAAILALSLSGCILGAAQIYTIGGGARSYAFQTDITVEACPSTGPMTYSCRLAAFLEAAGLQVWGAKVTIAGISVGLPGVLVLLLDPVILQVPADTTSLSGTYSGPANGSLSITTVTGPLQVDATRQMVPEPGTKFVIIDFPGGTLPAGPGLYHFDFGFTAPASVPSPLPFKVVFAGKVTVAGQTYYLPLFPCTTDMASIPTLVLPAANRFTPINPAPYLTQQACNNMTYDLTPAGSGTVGVVEYRNSDFDHYFVTPNLSDIQLLDNKTPPFQAWSRTGRIFRAYPNATAAAGSVAVCRFFNSNFGSKSSHFFALHGFGCEDTINFFPDWTLEYETYFKTMLPDASSMCAAGTVPLYRLYNQGMGGAPNHRFVTALSDKQDMVTQGWADEGVRMCLPQ